MSTKLVYDPDVTCSDVIFVCPECGRRFHGGGRALHDRGCSVQGYAGVVWHFGAKQVVKVVRTAKSGGIDKEWYGISLRMLQEQFPELVQEPANA